MLRIDEVIHASRGKPVGLPRNEQLTSVSTDTRTLEQGALFFALRGEHFDGHQFVDEAFRKGALAAVIDQKGYDASCGSGLIPAERFLIVVPDVYQALGAVAKFYREKFSIPVVAVTGSAGKTTTKECLRTLLEQRLHRGCASIGNLNNHIGLPLNLFRLTPQDQFAVFELGASARGEIRYLSSLAKPSIGIITCVHPAHLKGFGSLRGAYETKCELAEYLGECHGTLVIPGDDPELIAYVKKLKVRLIRFGRSAECEYRMTDLNQEEDTFSFVVNRKFAFRLKGFGLFNALNALAALSVVGHLGFNLKEVSEAWKEFVLVPNRFQVETLQDPRVRLVKDCYNANPGAFSQALESFCLLPVAGKRVAVVGDMKELGGDAEKYHQKLGEQIAGLPIDLVVATGDFAKSVTGAIQRKNYRTAVIIFSENQKIGEFLTSILRDGDSVLLKGSRSMKLEEVAEFLRRENSAPLVA